MTPLHWASKWGHVAVVQYLVETCKANVEAKAVSGGWDVLSVPLPHLPTFTTPSSRLTCRLPSARWLHTSPFGF